MKTEEFVDYATTMREIEDTLKKNFLAEQKYFIKDEHTITCVIKQLRFTITTPGTIFDTYIKCDKEA